ncbi:MULTISPECIES: tRNA (adenosine(37)-N6)-threonylcarbamoyltransferase complex dimerization subunit type 1 TsaB [Clostridiaceae]|uniref:tRNA (adenosine(37)-N6)-threonylcarbamoyltransferase complex dimerization subunit type 1 TsaB n=1 Tax=Clostridiaceae TaxID=31979 RepID=UPI000557F574|nr:MULTISPECIES: tRNA (adenosine(37)-N6)-threonylcarbamoyltransferase complex dimerization subunit type 1 TsaB [Clostridiaceae]
MRILSIDSSTEVASCAVLEDAKVLGEITFNYKKQHSVILMPMIENLLQNIGLNINSIDGFVCSKGPGSFTGLRIGMATIKGLCQGLNKPLVSVSSLDSLANNLAYTSGLICPILDALRDNVYTALFTFHNGKLCRITDYMAIHIDELINIIKEKNSTVTFIGDGTYKFSSKLRNSLDQCFFAPTHLNIMNSASLGQLGMELFKENKTDDILTASPVYLRKSQAEREYEKKKE